MPGAYDVHVHIQPYRMIRPEALAQLPREERPLVEKVTDDPSAFLDLLDEAGVERACLINYVAPEIMGFTDAVNRFVIDFAKDHRDRLIPFGSAHITATRDFTRVVDDLVHRHEIGGLKLHPPHQNFAPNAHVHGDRNLAHLYATAESAGVPVMIHTGTSVFPDARSRLGDPMLCDDVAVDYPDLKLILAHGGRPMWCESAFFLARRHPNVFIDLSSIPPKRVLHYFPRLEQLPEKFLFGSDWPAPGVPGIAANLRATAALPLSPDVLNQIVSRNAQRLLR